MNHQIVTGVDLAGVLLVLVVAAIVLIVLLWQAVESGREARPVWKRRRGRSADQGYEPPWWPEFERQFAAHVDRQEI